MEFVLVTKGVYGSSDNDIAFLHSFDCEDDADIFVANNYYEKDDNSFSFASKIKPKHHNAVSQYKATIIDDLMHSRCAICKNSIGEKPLSFKIKGHMFSTCSEKCKNLFSIDYLSHFGEDPFAPAWSP